MKRYPAPNEVAKYIDRTSGIPEVADNCPAVLVASAEAVVAQWDAQDRYESFGLACGGAVAADESADAYARARQLAEAPYFEGVICYGQSRYMRILPNTVIDR